LSITIICIGMAQSPEPTLRSSILSMYIQTQLIVVRTENYQVTLNGRDYGLRTKHSRSAQTYYNMRRNVRGRQSFEVAWTLANPVSSAAAYLRSLANGRWRRSGDKEWRNERGEYECGVALPVFGLSRSGKVGNFIYYSVSCRKHFCG